MSTLENLHDSPPCAAASDVEALALAMLRSAFKHPDLPPETRERFIASIIAGTDKLALGFEDFRDLARFALARVAPDPEVERAAWHAWYYDPEGYGGKTFGYQDTHEGHHAAFAAKSERAWLERAARQSSACVLAATVACQEPPAAEQPKPRKFPDDVYDCVDPAYELLDNGLLRHKESGRMRPKLYSDEPIPFKVGDPVKVVDGSRQFPLGTEGTVTHIEQGVVYFNGVACCWERLDPLPAATATKAEKEGRELERYRWIRQPSNLNCMMFEFKGNTPALVDAYIDKQLLKSAPGST